MTDYGHELQFGVFITPDAEQADAVRRARAARRRSSASTSSRSRTTRTRRASSTPGRCSRSSPRRRPTCGSPRTSRTCRCGRRSCSPAASRASTSSAAAGSSSGSAPGAFWDAIAALGGPRLTPGQAVDALDEAIDGHPRRHGTPAAARSATRASTTASSAPSPGPAPAHDVEIWLGAYKRADARADRRQGRRLAAEHGLRRRSDDLPAMNEAIDAPPRRPAARRPRCAGCSTSTGVRQRRRVPAGRPRDWAEQLAELTLEHRDERVHPRRPPSAEDIRRFAEEVAPAVRELVDGRRAAARREPARRATARRRRRRRAPRRSPSRRRRTTARG